MLQKILEKFKSEDKVKLHFHDIIGFGKFFEKNPKRDGRDPTFVRLENIILEQAKGSIFRGTLIGFAKLCYLAETGNVDKAVNEIEIKTRKNYYLDLCYSPVQELYEGNGVFISPTPLKRNKKFGGRACGHQVDYIDACLFGGKMAEVSKDYKNAKILYDRAKKVIDYEKFDGEYLTTFSQEYESRERTWKKAMKRMYKKGAFN